MAKKLIAKGVKAEKITYSTDAVKVPVTEEPTPNKAEHVVNETVIPSTVPPEASVPLSNTDKWINFLQGNRTYIVCLGGVVVSVLWYVKVIPEELAIQVLSGLGFGSIFALRASRK